jgi:hypothetical protein
MKRVSSLLGGIQNHFWGGLRGDRRGFKCSVSLFQCTRFSLTPSDLRFHIPNDHNHIHPAANLVAKEALEVSIATAVERLPHR